MLEKLYGHNPALLNEFFISYTKAYRDKFDFKNIGEYYTYIRTTNLVTLNTERVKSFEELEIANFFFINGINYKYESSYEHNVATKEHRQYKPDFFLPDYEIYIEHFAIDNQGHTPSFIDEAKYLSSREWKLQIHQEYQTTLIETFSHEKRSGVLTQILRKKLTDKGVVFNPLATDQALEKLNSSGYITELGNLLSRFLTLFKGSLQSLATLPTRVKPADIDTKRTEKFLEIFGLVYQEYESYLQSQSMIDFDDMIVLATDALKNLSQEIQYKYLLIDEFQDISLGRAELVKSLLLSNLSMKLMAVGDDWQSIYRFTGSDISVMTNFEEHFGRHEIRLLPETFRFNQMIERVASRFVLRNESQIKKVISARPGNDEKSVILWHPKANGSQILESIAQSIPIASSNRMQNILILARYRFYGDEINYSKLKKQRPDLNWTFSTVHSAKGAEADYAVILGVKSRNYSFPSEIADDPLLALVLAKEEQYPNAEERRLFYVAITRTKNSVYIVGDPTAESVFFSELAKDEDVDTSYLGKTFSRRCSECNASMLEKQSALGLFFGCSNFPLCTNINKPCTACGIGFLRKNSKSMKCDNEGCEAEYPFCPRCGDGTLITQFGRNGPFLGCTNFRSKDCRFTKSV